MKPWASTRPDLTRMLARALLSASYGLQRVRSMCDGHHQLHRRADRAASSGRAASLQLLAHAWRAFAIDNSTGLRSGAWLLGSISREIRRPHLQGDPFRALAGLVLIPPPQLPVAEARPRSSEASLAIAERLYLARGSVCSGGVVASVGPCMLATVVPATPSLRYAALDLLSVAREALSQAVPAWTLRGAVVPLGPWEQAPKRLQRLQALLVQAMLSGDQTITVEKLREDSGIAAWDLHRGRLSTAQCGVAEEPTHDLAGQSGPLACTLDTVTQPAYVDLDLPERCALTLAMAVAGTRLDGMPRLALLPAQSLRNPLAQRHIKEALSFLKPPQGTLTLTISAREALASMKSFERMAAQVRASRCDFGVHDLGNTEEDLQMLCLSRLDTVLLDRAISEGRHLQSLAHTKLIDTLREIATQQGVQRVLATVTGFSDHADLPHHLVVHR